MNEYYGETYRHTDDAHIQSFDVIDGTLETTLEVQFTESELQSNEIFCRDISKILKSNLIQCELQQ